MIDTFQRIRDGDNESTYANDYREVVKVKALADNFKIAVLLIHHLRKAPDSDPFNMVSGSTGIIGVVDSIYILEKQKRIENGAILHVTGCDIEDMQIRLEFDRDPSVWKFTGYRSKSTGKDDPVIKALCGFMTEQAEYTGTATELFAAFRDGNYITDDSGITANNLTRRIKSNNCRLKYKMHLTRTYYNVHNKIEVLLCQNRLKTQNE